MIVTKDQIEKEDNKRRKETLETIRGITTNFVNIRDSIYTLEDFFNIRNQISIPSITLNNKIIELNNLFKSKGIHMFSKKSYMFYGKDGSIPSIIPSSISEVVISSLIDVVNQCLDILNAYYERLNQAKQETIQNHRLALFIADLFPHSITKSFGLEDEEKIILSKLLEYYQKADDYIFNYNLRDHLIPSILTKIQEENISAPDMALLVEDDMIPDLEALELSDLIPKLKESINQYYQSQLPEGFNPSEEEKYLYIPDYEKAKEMRTMLIETLSATQSIEVSKPISTDTSTIIIEAYDKQPQTNPKIKQRKPETKSN